MNIHVTEMTEAPSRAEAETALASATSKAWPPPKATEAESPPRTSPSGADWRGYHRLPALLPHLLIRIKRS